MSVLAHLHHSMKIGNDYLKSTCVLDNELLHGSFFAFENKSYYKTLDTYEKSKKQIGKKYGGIVPLLFILRFIDNLVTALWT